MRAYTRSSSCSACCAGAWLRTPDTPSEPALPSVELPWALPPGEAFSKERRARRTRACTPGTTSILAYAHHTRIYIRIYICQDAASLRAFGELLLACEAQLPTSFVGPSVYGEARPGVLVEGLAEQQEG